MYGKHLLSSCYMLYTLLSNRETRRSDDDDVDDKDDYVHSSHLLNLALN